VEWRNPAENLAEIERCFLALRSDFNHAAIMSWTDQRSTLRQSLSPPQPPGNRG
jgi:hypothetical protein